MKEKMKSHPYLFLAAVFALLFLAGNELAAVTDTAESIMRLPPGNGAVRGLDVAADLWTLLV